MSVTIEKWEQDLQWLELYHPDKAARLGDDERDAFCERVAILCGQGVDEARARVLALRRVVGG